MKNKLYLIIAPLFLLEASFILILTFHGINNNFENILYDSLIVFACLIFSFVLFLKKEFKISLFSLYHGALVVVQSCILYFRDLEVMERDCFLAIVFFSFFLFCCFYFLKNKTTFIQAKNLKEEAFRIHRTWLKYQQKSSHKIGTWFHKQTNKEKGIQPFFVFRGGKKAGELESAYLNNFHWSVITRLIPSFRNDIQRIWFFFWFIFGIFLIILVIMKITYS